MEVGLYQRRRPIAVCKTCKCVISEKKEAEPIGDHLSQKVCTNEVQVCCGGRGLAQEDVSFFFFLWSLKGL